MCFFIIMELVHYAAQRVRNFETTSHQGRYNVIDVDATLNKRHVPAIQFACTIQTIY